eukprot:2265240-Pyramimonas_sp.AAC.1
MFLGPKSVLRTKARILEQKPDVIKQDKLRQKCSESMSRKPQQVLRALLGRAMGEPGSLATA